MDNDDNYRPPRHWGDFGALFLAGGFSLFGLYLIVDMLLGGHPLAILFRPPAQEQAQPSRAAIEAQWNEKKFTTAPGEVIISTNTFPPPPAGRAAFPEIRDWSSLSITLERGACLGACPIYSVRISGDGTVVFRGVNCVAVKGEQVAHISAADVRQLFQKFRDADFFALSDRYAASVTDMPTYTTSISFDGHAKSVTDYAGSMVAMPRVVTDLENAIDKTAGTARFVSDGHGGCR